MRQLVVVPAREADLIASEKAAPVRRTPAQSVETDPLPSPAMTATASAPEPSVAMARPQDALRQSDDLAALIEALEIFTAEQEAARASVEGDASTTRPADR